MATKTETTVRHEDFCVTDEPRIERYTDRNGAAPLVVTRCLDCGATKYAPVT